MNCEKISLSIAAVSVKRKYSKCDAEAFNGSGRKPCFAMKNKIVPRPQSWIDNTAGGIETALDGVETNKASIDFNAGFNRVVKRRNRTQAEIDYQTRVAALGCICCRLLDQPQWTRTYIHHVRINAKRQDNHFNVLPLCYDCHQSNVGVHGDKSILRAIGKTEIELLQIVKEMIE